MIMNKLILFIILPLVTFGQNSKNIFFGIDLNLDWYSLTNFSAASYYIADQENKLPYIVTDFKYYHDKIDSELLNLKFEELLLGFPKGNTQNFDKLKPELFIARKNYTDLSTYLINSRNDLTKSYDLLIKRFGDPDLNMIREKFTVYRWKKAYFDIVLTCREDELSTTILYVKN